MCIILLVFLTALYSIPPAKAVCCPRVSLTHECCGRGPCNIFCCNCDGGCHGSRSEDPTYEEHCYARRKREILLSHRRSPAEVFDAVDADGNGLVDVLEAAKFLRLERAMIAHNDTLPEW